MDARKGGGGGGRYYWGRTGTGGRGDIRPVSNESHVVVEK